MKRLGFVLLSVSFAHAQQYIISTYAGAPRPPSVNTSFGSGALTTDASGNVYFVANSQQGIVDQCLTCVFKLDPNGVLTRVAGSAQRGFSSDGGPATSAQLGSPVGLAIDQAGNLFIADDSVTHFGTYPNGYSTDRIRKVSSDGIITTIAGGGTLSGSDADGGLATNAKLYFPTGVAVDRAGNVFFAESLDADGYGSNRIRKVSPDGIITTVAGNGMYGFSGDGGLAINAQLAGPFGLAIDSAGNLFFVDSYNDRIREVTPDGMINTVVDASGSAAPYCGCSVTSVNVDGADNLLYGRYSSIYKRSPAGVISTVVGADVGLPGFWLASDVAGNVFLSSYSGGLLRISPDGTVTTIVGDAACCFSGDGGFAVNAQLLHSNSVAADGAGNLFIADTGNRRLRWVTPDGIIRTIAGNGVWNADINCNAVSGDSGPALSAQLCSPSQVAVEGVGNLFIVDQNRIRKISQDGTISSIAGDGTIGTGGDGGLATQAQLAYPNSVAVDAAGNIYFAEWARVRRISPDGIITTVAGTGQRPQSNCWPPEFPGCGPPPPGGGQATLALLYGPQSVSVDGAGNIYFVDAQLVLKVSPDGILTTVAGNVTAVARPGVGDGGAATSAALLLPRGVTVDSAGNLFIAEVMRIRQVTNGIINTIAGTSNPGYSGDGGPATQAQLANPSGLTVDPAGNIFFADSNNNVIRVLRPVP